MLLENITIDDAKTLLLTHESGLKRRKSIPISPLPFINFTMKNNTNSNITNQRVCNNNLPLNLSINMEIKTTHLNLPITNHHLSTLNPYIELHHLIMVEEECSVNYVKKWSDSIYLLVLI